MILLLKNLPLLLFLFLSLSFLLTFHKVYGVDDQQQQQQCANVTDVTARRQSTIMAGSHSMWTFSVSVQSQETGWDKYADEWQIRSTSGSGRDDNNDNEQNENIIIIYGTRTLLHPHVDEQPFTRSLNDVTIPNTEISVIVAARDSVLGYCGQEFLFILPNSAGADEEEEINEVEVENGTIVNGNDLSNPATTTTTTTTKPTDPLETSDSTASSSSSSTTTTNIMVIPRTSAFVIVMAVIAGVGLFHF